MFNEIFCSEKHGYMNIFKNIIPPRQWRFPVLIASGILAGLAIYVFYISKAYSYLSDDSRTCINCHIMTPQYITWQHSAHRENTNCNDCHVPHDNIVRKYYFKAKDGLRHASMFTLRLEPQVITMHEPGQKVVQENCKRCHYELNADVSLIEGTLESSKHGEGRLCWECHREVPHGRVNSLSATSFAQAPLLESPVPGWLKTQKIKETKNKIDIAND